MNKFLQVSRRHDNTGDTIWIRLDTIRNITLPWRCDVLFNPKAADYLMPYRITFDGAEHIEHAFTSVEELRAAGIKLSTGLRTEYRIERRAIKLCVEKACRAIEAQGAT